MIATNLKIKDGVLEFAGFSTPALARKYGTPLYLMDEQRIRDNCRMYQTAMTEFFGENALFFIVADAKRLEAADRRFGG
jgi:diaminopimelate decarboxylase